MNVRINKKLRLALAVICMLNFTSCSKYDDGSLLSLKTKNKRLIGEWEVVEIDGDDPKDFVADELTEGSLSPYSNPMMSRDVEVNEYEVAIEFEKGGDFIMEQKSNISVEYSYSSDSNSITYDVVQNMEISGDWEWDSAKESIEVDIDNVDDDIRLDGISLDQNDLVTDLDEYDDEFEILRLTKDELWFEDSDGIEYQCKKK